MVFIPFETNRFWYSVIMAKDEQFDFWYAVNNTEVVAAPQNRLETFGSTFVNYHLVTEMLDSVDKVRVREGKLKAVRPEILTPDHIAQMMLEGFSEEARDYADWLSQNAGDLRILKYGFAIQKQDINDYILSDPLPAVVNRVKEELEAREDPLGAVLVGVEKPWEVCLLKLMVELVQGSAAGNMLDIQQRDRDEGIRQYMEIEQAFHEAAKDRDKLTPLADLLKRKNLFEKYEDRFFALVQSANL